MSSKIICAAMAVALIVGCDIVHNKTIDNERSESAYKNAMVDYSAGRIDNAIKGFEKVLKLNPANSSARFQLACLLQDVKKDYLGAFCNYREFILLSEKGQKSALAESRMNECSIKVAKDLAMKHNVGDVARLTSQVEALEKELAEAKKHIAKLSEANKALLSDKETMSEEIKNVRKMVSGLGAEDSTSDGPKDLAALKDLDKDDDKKEDFSVPDEVLKLDSEAEEKSVEVVSEDVKEKTEDPFLAKKGFVGKKDENSSTAVTEKPALVEKPEFYVVKEGDTLYKIALRFYGKSSAWRIVRDANKTVISTDGRIKVGQKIRLP